MIRALRTKPELWPLVGFAVFTAMALAGYGTFGLHPALLTRFPGAEQAYAGAYRLFSRGQIWVAFGVILFPLIRYAGFKWITSFALVFAISLGSELMGTNYGVPFGGYHYTDLLGYKLMGDVPYLIPLSWFFMAIPAWAMSRLAFPDTKQRAAPIILGAVLLTIWDLALDPAMSHLTPFWQWQDTGPYYGVPWINLFGWFVTGIVIMAGLTALKVDSWLAPIEPRWMIAFYGLNLAMPLGMCALAGLWLAVATTLAALATTALTVRAAAGGTIPWPETKGSWVG